MQTYDEGWYKRFRRIGSFQAYEYYVDSLKKLDRARRAFFVDRENPTLEYPKLEFLQVGRIMSHLTRLRNDIYKNECNEVVRLAYLPKIDEKLSELRLLEATKKNDMDSFLKETKILYGYPDRSIFNNSLHQLRELIHVLKNKRNDFGLMYDLINFSSAEKDQSTIPNYVFDIVANDTVDLMRNLYANEKRKDFYESQDMLELFSDALLQLGSNEWFVHVNKNSSSSAISANQEERIVTIPKKRSVSHDKLMGLIVHEIGTHVSRAVMGERSPLKLLGLGLNKYEKGEEGVATIREEIFSSNIKNYSRADSHMMIGLVLGYDGKRRDFSELFEIACLLLRIRNKQSNSPMGTMKIKKLAWNRCVRIFRGTDCKTKGICFTKDSIYERGNREVWQELVNNPYEIKRLNRGKYDPANKDHQQIITMLDNPNNLGIDII